MYNKHGKIVSVKKHKQGKDALKNLINAGYVAKKGEFKLFRKNQRGGDCDKPETYSFRISTIDNKSYKDGEYYYVKGRILDGLAFNAKDI